MNHMSVILPLINLCRRFVVCISQDHKDKNEKRIRGKKKKKNTHTLTSVFLMGVTSSYKQESSTNRDRSVSADVVNFYILIGGR